MAQKRMLDKKISLSEQVADLSIPAALLFTWSIPHTDDIGLLPRSHRTLKAAIVPMWEYGSKDFDGFVAEIVKQKLWQPFEYSGEQFYILTKFQGHQTLKKDRQPQTRLGIKVSKDPKETWNTVNSILANCGIQLEDSTSQEDAEEKGSEVKRSKVKKKPSGADTRFDEFWAIYPNKKAKKKAQESWAKIEMTDELFADLMKGLQIQVESKQWKKDGGAYVPHPATWLNQERWSDEVSATGEVTNKTDVI